MRILLTTGLALLFGSAATAQSNWRLGLFGGVSQYAGDLKNKFFEGRFARPAVGLTASYNVLPRLALRAGFTLTGLRADDRYNTQENLRARNLSFYTKLTEFSLVGEYTFFNLEDTRWSPYVFAGVAVFHYNPYTYDSSGQKWYLEPLGTEGQGLPSYPDRKAYNLTQLSIPFGGGITYAFNEHWQLGIELGIRKTFTDYLDDVSSTYAGRDELMAARGPKAVELAFRGGEVDPLANYPEKDAMRGQAKKKDWYYLTGLHLQYRFGGGGAGGKRGKYGCPSVGL